MHHLDGHVSQLRRETRFAATALKAINELGGALNTTGEIRSAARVTLALLKPP